MYAQFVLNALRVPFRGVYLIYVSVTGLGMTPTTTIVRAQGGRAESEEKSCQERPFARVAVFVVLRQGRRPVASAGGTRSLEVGLGNTVVLIDMSRRVMGTTSQ